MLCSDEFIKFNMRTAGYTFAVSVRFEQTRKLCEKFIVPDAEAADLEVVVTKNKVDEIIESARIEAERNGLEFEKVALSYQYYEFLALHKMISDWLPERGTVMFHCSSVMVDGEAYLFTAPSGTGKSTHSSYWKKLLGDRMTYINDDKPFLKKAADDNVIYACGSPWCGKHFLGENVSAPIKAIGIIVRDEKNFTKRVKPLEAFITLYKQTYLPREDEKQMQATILMMKNLAENIPMYEIHCNMSVEAAEVAYADLSKIYE